MKDILTTGLGMFIFGDVKFNAKNLVGVAIGLMGGILYSYFSYRDSQQKAAREAVRTSAGSRDIKVGPSRVFGMTHIPVGMLQAYGQIPTVAPGDQALNMAMVKPGLRTSVETDSLDRGRLRRVHTATSE